MIGVIIAVVIAFLILSIFSLAKMASLADQESRRYETEAQRELEDGHAQKPDERTG